MLLIAMRRTRTILASIAWSVLYWRLVGNPLHAQQASLLADATPGLPADSSGLELDVFEADALIWAVFSDLEVMHYDTATQSYLWLLSQVDHSRAPEETPILLKHLRPLAMIMPPPDQAKTGLDAALKQDDPTRFPPGLGTRLVLWWQQQDPLPATPGNQRLEEHLTRDAFALHKYAQENDIRGFDDRGEIYIRLGKPSRSKQVTIKKSALLVSPHSSKVPENEFWVYKHVGYDAHYVFLRKTPKQAFELGYATDLIPQDLRNGRRKTALLL